MRSRGFTFVEMIVVVAVIGLLATIIVLQFNGTNSAVELDSAISVVHADIRRATVFATTGKTCCAADAVPEGYGLVFTPGTTAYILYADVDGDHLYSASSTDEVIQTIDLETDELISDVIIQTCSPAAVPGGPCDFLATVPAGTLYTAGTRTTDFSVTLQQIENAQTEEITVDINSGQIN